MLHMVVSTHTPQDCAFRDDHARAELLGGLEGLEAACGANGASLAGAWMNMSGHTGFLLIDAPDAHAVDRILRDAGLIGRTHSQVYAVGAAADVIAGIRGS